VFPVSSPPYEILDVWIYIFLPLNKEDFGFDDFSSHLRVGNWELDMMQCLDDLQNVVS
jgi:hypothetical protein